MKAVRLNMPQPPHPPPALPRSIHPRINPRQSLHPHQRADAGGGGAEAAGIGGTGVAGADGAELQKRWAWLVVMLAGGDAGWW
jgi:hypothetical protein